MTDGQASSAGFLTEIHRLSKDLARKRIELVIAGDPGGLFHLVGWDRRFRLYENLVAAVMARAPCRAQSDPAETRTT